MTYQKIRQGHKFIDTEPIPSREELMSIIRQESYEMTFVRLDEDYRKHPVYAAINWLYMLTGLFLFCWFCMHANGFGVACAASMLALPVIISPFTKGFTHKHKPILRIVSVIVAFLLLGLTVVSGLSHFGMLSISLPVNFESPIVVAFIIVFIFLSFPFAIMVFLIVNGIAERKCTEEVSATCIGYDCDFVVIRNNGHRRKTIRYTPVYQYYTSEGEQTAVSKATTEDPTILPHIGETRSIWYNPRKHDEIRITEKPSVSWGIVAALAIVIILFAGITFGISSQIEVTPPSSPTQTEDGRTILTDSLLNQQTGSEAWRIALRTVTKVEEQDGKLCVYFEKLSGFALGTAIPAEEKAQYASIKAGDQLYWVQSGTSAMLFSADAYVYDGNKKLVTEQSD